MSLIEVRDVRKNYKIYKNRKGLVGSFKNLIKPDVEIKHAVNGISFTIGKGEAVGLIGPNGAGKSTMVKMLTGILVPNSGEIRIAGLVPYKERKKHAAKIGVVFGQRSQLWWDIPVRDTFELLKHIYKIPNEVYKKNIEVFNELLDLKDFISQPVRQLSLGQRMRADIAASLLHNPEIIFFDEPTIGVDIVAKDKIREFVRFMNNEYGLTVLFTTHDMTDIEKTCNRMIIIDKGIVVYDGKIHEIKKRYGKFKTLTVEFGESYQLPESLPGVTIVNKENNEVDFVFDRDEVQVSELISTLSNQYNVVDLTVRDVEIESIIKDIYTGGINLESIS